MGRRLLVQSNRFTGTRQEGREAETNRRNRPTNAKSANKERLLRVFCQRRPNTCPVSLCVSQLRAWYFCLWLRALLHFPLLPLLPTTPTPHPHPGAPARIAGNGELVSKHGGTQDDSRQGRRGHAATRTRAPGDHVAGGTQLNLPAKRLDALHSRRLMNILRLSCAFLSA